MASRSLNDLAPEVKVQAVAFKKECHRVGLQVLIYCTLRSDAEQAGLYAMGRTHPGAVVTYALPGESLHNPDKNGQAWAFDAVPMMAGKCLWNNYAALKLMGTCGESVGLMWAGRWAGNFQERVHFQGVRGG